MNIERFAHRAVATGMVLLVNLMVGCQHLPPSAAQRVKQADVAYRAAGYEQARHIASLVIDKHPLKIETAEAYYLRGLSNLKLRRRSSAASDFRSALKLCERRDLEVFVRLELANLAFDSGAYREAMTQYANVINELPTEVPSDEVWYRYGVALQRYGDFGRSRQALLRAAGDRRPRPVNGSAWRKMTWQHDYFTVQCGAFATARSATAARDALRRKGIPASVTTVSADRVTRHVVQTGRYSDFPAARSALASIRRVQSDAFIIP